MEKQKMGLGLINQAPYTKMRIQFNLWGNFSFNISFTISTVCGKKYGKNGNFQSFSLTRRLKWRARK